MFITWDDRKNESNYKKHKIWFEEAVETVLNPLSLVAKNHFFLGNRFEYLGYSATKKILYVVTAEEDEIEIRIISARSATKTERKKYEEGI